MKAVILCGGIGSRMGKMTKSIPKPLLKIGERPILWHIMKHYSVYGFKDFILCLGYKGEVIQSYFNELNDDEVQSWNIVFADTGLDSPTGLRLEKVKDHISGNVFLATYGDSLVDVPVSRVVEYHQRMKCKATVVGMKTRIKFGLFRYSDGKATGFEEKPEIPDGLINAGFFVFDKEVFEYLDQGPLESMPIKKLIADGELAVYEHGGVHRCVDTPWDLEVLNQEWEQGMASWKTW